MCVKICVFFVGLKLCQNMFSSNKKMVAWGLLMYVLHFIAVWLPRRPSYEIMLYGTIITQAKGFENMWREEGDDVDTQVFGWFVTF